MTSLLYRISCFPESEAISTELLERVLVALVLDLSVDVLFYGDGVKWLHAIDHLDQKDQAKLAQIKLLQLYGVNKVFVLQYPSNLLRSKAMTCDLNIEWISIDSLADLLHRYEFIR